MRLRGLALVVALAAGSAACTADKPPRRCGEATAPLPVGSSTPVEVEDGPVGLQPISVNGLFYGLAEDAPLRSAHPVVTTRPGVVTNTGNGLILSLEDGRRVPLTQFFCD